MNRAVVAIGVLLVVLIGVAVFALGGADVEPTAAPAPSSTEAGAATPSPADTTGAGDSTTEPQAATTTESLPDYAPLFELTTCRFDPIPDRDPQCGDLVVPEDRSDPTGRQVRLHVAIFESDDPNAPDDPIVYLDGGPGGETLDVLAFGFEDSWGGFLAERDLILFDQRGVGLSEPSLECSEARDHLLDALDEDLSADEYLAGEIAAYEACQERLLGDGIDLTQYNTVANAADVADLRVALRLDEWNILGVSYGTRLAQGVMRDHPEGIRSVILDSAYPLDVDLFTALPGNYDRALAELFEACDSDATCASTYPDLEARLFALADRLEADPVQMSIRDIFTGQRYDALLDGEVLLGLVFQGLYSNEIIPSLPQLVADLERSDTTIASLLLTNRVAQSAFISDGMYLSVQCNEEVPFSSAEEAEAAAAAYPQLELFSQGNTGFYQECDLWQSGRADPAENVAIASDLPTLVLAGEFDPITPPAWGQQVIGGLSNATYVEFPGIGHAASLSDPCPLQVALDFFDDPSAEPDTACVRQMASPMFTTGEVIVTEVNLVPFEEDVFGVTIAGVVPDGWESVGPGAWARGTNFTDQTAIVQQAVPGAGDPELLIGLFASQLGFADDPVPNGTHQGGDRSWTLYTGVIDGFPTEVALGARDGITGIVVLVTSEGERSALREQVLLPALDAFTAS